MCELMLTDADLDELDRLEREATSGPWRHSTDGLCHHGSGQGANRKTDFAMIVASRNALRALIDEVRAWRWIESRCGRAEHDVDGWRVIALDAHGDSYTTPSSPTLTDAVEAAKEAMRR